MTIPLLSSFLAISLVLAVSSTARIVWIRRQLREMRQILVSVHGYPEDEEMHSELKKAAVRISPRLGRFVRVDNLGSTCV
jgi:hypothetical protein